MLHLAATKIPRYESALENLTINLEGSKTALEVARSNQAKFVLASTSDVYGKSPDLPFREDGDVVIGTSTSRRWAYAITKLCDEHMALAYQDEFGIPVTILRFFGSYGERQYLNWWGGPQGVFLKAISDGEPWTSTATAARRGASSYIADLVEATARAIEREEANGEILNIGTTEEVSIKRLAEVMHELSPVEGEPKHRTRSLRVVHAELPGRDAPRAGSGEAERILGFEPQVNLEEGSGGSGSGTRSWASAVSASAPESSVTPDRREEPAGRVLFLSPWPLCTRSAGAARRSRPTCSRRCWKRGTRSTWSHPRASALGLP